MVDSSLPDCDRESSDTYTLFLGSNKKPEAPQFVREMKTDEGGIWKEATSPWLRAVPD